LERKHGLINAHNNPSKDIKALGTAVSDETTEMSTKTSSMQTDFTSIIKQPQEADKATKKLISDTKAKRPNADKLLLDAFAVLEKQGDEAIKAARETCDKALQKVALSMCAAIACS
jgi:hypothetical protein